MKGTFFVPTPPPNAGRRNEKCPAVGLVNGVRSNPPCQLVGVAVARGVNIGHDREARNAGDASEDKAPACAGAQPQRSARAALTATP
ncbi:MAG: hypothetical protein M5U15_11610 [Kiritimatiellae bacterium]|nr:hypothetical protein [Kiritimatiellia bacterium]